MKRRYNSYYLELVTQSYKKGSSWSGQIFRYRNTPRIAIVFVKQVEYRSLHLHGLEEFLSNNRQIEQGVSGQVVTSFPFICLIPGTPSTNKGTQVGIYIFPIMSIYAKMACMRPSDGKSFPSSSSGFWNV